MRAQTNETFIIESVCRLSVQVTKEMARTLSRCPGPMQALKSKSEKEQALLRTPVNNIEYFPPNFEGLVLGCIDADFCK